eukprot:jgi/Orpsp1_1/1190542/evm.model.d7180000079647.1
MNGEYVAYKYTVGNTRAFSPDTSVSGMKTYQKVASDSNIYVEVTDLSKTTFGDLQDLLLLTCASGKCTGLSGYVIIGGKTIYENFSVPGTWTKVNEVACSSGATDNIGGVKKTDEGKIQLCMASGGSSQALSNVGTTTYYTGTASGYKKYIGNTKNTIIALPIP